MKRENREGAKDAKTIMIVETTRWVVSFVNHKMLKGRRANGASLQTVIWAWRCE